MIVEQIYTSCLAQGAYYIQSDGEAAVIDPLREYQPYLNLAAKNNAKIKYVFETHFHADFVSGHIDLATKTGADIVFGPNAKTNYKSIIATDNQEFTIGKLTLKVIHTPGHTLESTCYLLLDGNKKPLHLFTGDTLFIGDVGRPDLAIKSNLTQHDLAGMLFDSLRNKIMTLPDDVIIYPAHGAGSACGKNMSKETFDTLGNQKKINYALANISKAEFITELTTGILPAPQYFSKNANLNKEGYKNIDEVFLQGSKALSVTEIKHLLLNTNAIILDVRKPHEFANAHIPNSLFIGIDGQFAPWVGALITNIHQPIIVVAPIGREAETVMRLSRVGYDNCIGYVDGGIDAWQNSGNQLTSIKSIEATEFAQNLNSQTTILDVRKPGEYESCHLKDVGSYPLDYIPSWQNNLVKDKEYHIHCAGGYRSMIAASILKQNGYHKLIDIAGGFGAIQQTSIKTISKECASVKACNNEKPIGFFARLFSKKIN